MKVVFATPTMKRPFPQYLASMEASVPILDAAGIDHVTHSIVFEVGSAYISHARSTMLDKALKAEADAVVFLDHDLGWAPRDLLTLIETKGDVVAGTYRFKRDDEEEYMGSVFCDDDNHPYVREDGCLRACSVPAGFLKVTRQAVEIFGRHYPELLYGSPLAPCIDLFNHGAYKGVWWGEDYAFSRRWRECGGDIWLVPNLDISHHTEERDYPGNFYKYMRKLNSEGSNKSEAITQSAA